MAEIDKRILNMGEVQFSYRLVYAERKTLGISVNPEGSVQVKAPLNATMEQIEQKLRKRAGWIIRQQRFFGRLERLHPSAGMSAVSRISIWEDNTYCELLRENAMK